MKRNKDRIYLFKVRDYTTILVGRYDRSRKSFYIERGDGTRYEYHKKRVTWFKIK